MLGRADGRPYEELVVERLARPLGMEDTRIRIDDASKARLAPPHLAGGAAAKNWDLAALAGAGGLRSTADDLLRFLAANLGGAPSDLLRAMELSHEARAKVQEGGPWVGLGWHRTRLGDGRTMIWHNGGTGGYRSFCGFVKESGTAAVVLANSTADVDALGVAVLELLGR
jgi:CubicO group peptidase (beta-lactamase class C family)